MVEHLVHRIGVRGPVMSKRYWAIRGEKAGRRGAGFLSAAQRRSLWWVRSGLRRFAGTPVIVHDQHYHLNYRSLPSQRSKSPLQCKL
jgi:hypothetical protein